MSKVDTSNILNALIAVSEDKIWATEVAFFSGQRRIDFWTLEPSQSQGFRASAYEIKISRGDFRRDSHVKQDGALRWSDRFWYVTPPGLLKRDELPPWSGLLEWDGKKFSATRKAPRRFKAEPSWEFIVSLLRNSGEVKRDVGLLKAQLAFYQLDLERTKEQERVRNQRLFKRWTRRAVLIPGHTDDRTDGTKNHSALVNLTVAPTPTQGRD